MTVSLKKAFVVSIASLVASSTLFAAPLATDPKPDAGPLHVGDFALLDQQGVFHQLSHYRYKKAFVVMSYDFNCASDQKAMEALDQVRKSYESKDVAFMLMDSKAKEDRNAVRAAASKANISYPILMDHAQLVAETLGIRQSGSVVVLDPEGPQLLYRGPAQAQIGEVLDAKLSGKAESAKIVPVQGCPLELQSKKRDGASVPDYVKDIVPIVQNNCVMCHHEGGIGPWAMSNYSMLKGWSPMMREVLLTKRMPPMQVDPNISHFSNARYISDHDLQTLIHWIDAGSPRGSNPDDPLVKLHFGTRTDWQLGKPDYIVTAPTHEVPAVGVLDYINDTIELSFNEDKWVRAVQFIPGDPRVLHHLLSYVVGPKDSTPGGEATTTATATRFLEGYAPGKVDAMIFPKDTGVYIPKGNKLAMQFHYTPNGHATTDTTVVGLYFYDKPPKFEYLNIPVAGQFKIPPFARDYKTKGDYVFKDPVVVYGLRAHMHFRGHDMKFTADLPDGTTRELLSVPNYSYAWQPTYQLVEPVTLPAGTKVHVTGAFDNSQYNPANPDPSKELTFGLQSWDEMFIGYWSYTSTKATN
jgi:peroxiredoxin